MPATYYMKHHAVREQARQQVKLAKTCMENTMLEYRTRGMVAAQQQLEEKIYMAQLACDTVCAQFPEEPPHTGPNFFGRLPPVLVEHVIAMMLEPKELAALIGTGRPYVGLVKSYRPLRQFCFWYKPEDPTKKSKNSIHWTKGTKNQWMLLEDRFEKDSEHRWRAVDGGLMQLVSLIVPKWLHQGKPGQIMVTNCDAYNVRELYDFAMKSKVPVPVMLREIDAWKEQLAKQRQLK